MARVLIDMVGQKFGNLTVLKMDRIESRPSGGTIVYWRCKCACGKVTTSTRSNLMRPNTLSCGCMNHKLLPPRSYSYKRRMEG